jgi:hypothetical protein
MAVYENRSRLYLELIRQVARSFEVMGMVVDRWIDERGGGRGLRERTARVLRLDEAFCPRAGEARVLRRAFDFPAARVEHLLSRMELPREEAFQGHGVEMEVAHPGKVGEVLMDPDGGSWMRGTIASLTPPAE